MIKSRRSEFVATRMTRAEKRLIASRKYRHESLGQAVRRLALQEASRDVAVAEADVGRRSEVDSVKPVTQAEIDACR